MDRDDTDTQPRVITLDNIRLARHLGLLDTFRKDPVCTRCGWPIAGVIHQDTCHKPRKARKAQPAPAQPWQPRPLREAA